MQSCLGVTALGNLNSMTPMHFWTDQVPKSLGDPNWVDPKFKWFDFVHILSRKNSSQSYQGCIWVLWTVSDKPSSEMQMLLIIILFLPLISANSDWRILFFFSGGWVPAVNYIDAYTLTHEIPRLLEGTSYEFRVFAVNAQVRRMALTHNTT